MPVGVVVARVAGDIARPGNAPLVPTEAGRMLGIFDLLVVVIFAYVDSFKEQSRGHSKEVQHVSVCGVFDGEAGRRLKSLLQLPFPDSCAQTRLLLEEQ